MRAAFWPAAVVLTGGIALTAQGSSPAQQSPTFRADSLLVPVDIRVIDRNRQPVTDLTRADFTILEDGVRQTISHFLASALTPDSAAASGASTDDRGADAAIDPAAPVNRRVFLIVVGQRVIAQSVAASPLVRNYRCTIQGEVGHPADGILHFLRERLLPQDLVAVLAWNRVTSFTTDHQHLVDLIERLAPAQDLIESLGCGSAAPAQAHVDAVFRSPEAMDAHPVLAGPIDRFPDDSGKLRFGIDYLRHVSGEKHLIFVSQRGRGSGGGIARAAAAARVAVDYVYTGGTAAPGINFTTAGVPAPFGVPTRAVVPSGPNLFAQAQSAGMLAALTGGVSYWNKFWKVGGDFDTIDDTTRFQYVLGYSPSRVNNDGKFRQIEVRVNRPGVTLLYRHGYFATPDVAVFDPERALTSERLSAAVAAPRLLTAIPIRITIPNETKTGGSIQTDLRVNPSALQFARDNGHNVASVVLAVWYFDDHDRVVRQAWNNVPLSFTDDELHALAGTGVPLSLDAPPMNGARRMKVVIYQYATDRIGSAVAKIR